jgi:hypothetical protein
MKLNIRRLEENDWPTLENWWNSWDEWVAPPRDFLPDNGTGGFIVHNNNTPIVAGFIYFTNSKAALLEYIISNPEYREKDRGQAIEFLITAAENVLKDKGFKYVFSIGRNKHLINKHKNLGWTVDKKPSHEIIKVI